MSNRDGGVFEEEVIAVGLFGVVLLSFTVGAFQGLD